MKATTIEEAKSLARAKSLKKKHNDESIFIIYCNRTKNFYVDTNGLVRLWERSHGYYENGVYIAEDQNHNP